MKKALTVLMVAALAASVNAQVVLGGDTAQKSNSNPAASVQAAGPSVNLSTHVWLDNHMESYMDSEGPTKAASADADVDPTVATAFKGEMGARTLIGQAFYVKAMSFYEINQGGLGSATIIGGPGAQIGPVSFGVNVGTSLTDMKGVKLGADFGWNLSANTSVFAWGNFLLNPGSSKNSVIKLDGRWIRGSQDFSSWDVGVGFDTFAVDGLYFGGIASMYADNNRWEVVKDVPSKDLVVSTVDITAKVGVVQDGRLLYLGAGWVTGRKIVDGDPSSELKLLVGVKFQ